MRYDYCVVRFVPDAFKAEFVNIGLIVGSAETGEWKVQRVQNGERASRFRNGAPLAAAWSYLDDLAVLAGDLADGERDLLPNDTFAPGWLEDEYRRMRNMVQLSRPAPVRASSADEAMSKLWANLVVDQERQTYATPGPARQALWSAYKAARLDSNLIHRNCHASRGHQDVKVDFAVGNGQLVQLAQAWSFRGPNPDRALSAIRDWSWIVRDVREQGGRVQLQGERWYDLDDRVALRMVHDEPDTADGARARDAAYEVFEGLGAEAFPSSQVGEVARQARAALAASDYIVVTESSSLKVVSPGDGGNGQMQ